MRCSLGRFQAFQGAARKRLVQFRGHLDHVRVEQLAVDVHREFDRGVTELLLDSLRVS